MRFPVSRIHSSGDIIGAQKQSGTSLDPQGFAEPPKIRFHNVFQNRKVLPRESGEDGKGPVSDKSLSLNGFTLQERELSVKKNPRHCRMHSVTGGREL
jgi:hypothetical protein